MKKEKSFLQRRWSDILLAILIILFLIPQTRKPIQVSLNRIFAGNPTELAKEKQETLDQYDWRLLKLDGTSVNFSEAKGRVVILNYWATWCPPCIAEMPSFQKLYEDYGDKVAFYFVSQEEAAPLLRFMEKKEYSLPVYRSLARVPEALMSNSLPTTFVISKDQQIVVKKTGAADWNTQSFRKLLDDLLTE